MEQVIITIEINEKVKAVAPTKKAQSKKSELPETGGKNKQRYVVRRIIQHSRFSIITQK